MAGGWFMLSWIIMNKTLLGLGSFIFCFFLCRSIIRWSVGEGCHEGEFVMSEPESVARFVSRHIFGSFRANVVEAPRKTTHKANLISSVPSFSMPQ